MILSKKLYLKRGFFRTLWLCFAHAAVSVRLLFKGESVAPVDESRRLGLPILTLKQAGELQCNACGLCIGFCPTNALDLSATDEAKVRDFKLDVLKCITCGLCQDVCPVDAIRMGKEKGMANHAESNWILDAKELSRHGVISRLG